MSMLFFVRVFFTCCFLAAAVGVAGAMASEGGRERIASLSRYALYVLAATALAAVVGFIWAPAQ